MSNCTFCGAVEYWHADGDGSIAKPTCHRCHPPETKVLPLDVGKEYIDKVGNIHGMPIPVNSALGATGKSPPAISFGNDPNTGIAAVNSNDIVFTVDDSSHPTSLNIEGSEVLTAYEELPKDAEEGKIAFKKGEDTAYVYDGEEWQNLGAALRRTKPPGRDAKCDRRAAIAATKAKNND